MFCTNCGKNIREGALFCSNCGAKLQTPQSADAQMMEAEYLRQEAEACREAEMAKAEELRRQAQMAEAEELRRREEYARYQEEIRRQAEFRRLAEEEYKRQCENRIKEIENGYREQYAREVNKVQNAEKYRSQAITAMVLGILSLELCVLGVPGWVLSIIAKNKAQPIIEDYEGTPIYGFARAGWITSKVALPFAIVLAIIWTIYLFGMGSVGMI